MIPGEIAEEIWEYIQRVVTARGYIFTKRCDELTRDLMTNAAHRLGEQPGVSPDLRKNVDRFLGLMMEGADGKVLKEQDFYYAMSKFCPLFPFC
jgi:hypothetical protein